MRRLNRAPGGTATILRMRERLLELKREDRELDAVDWDLRHLLSSWFNPGFLQIVRVDWRTPAYLLEQIILHEAVHEIQGWNDLHRRLEADGRCFAFFHPALPDEPLIFVEVALMNRMADVVRFIARRAIHFERSQPGDHGGFLLDQQLPAGLARSVARQLPHQTRCRRASRRSFPGSRCFARCHRSPVSPPGSGRGSRTADDELYKPLAKALKAVAKEIGTDPAKIAGDPKSATERLATLREPLTQLCATYLLASVPRQRAGAGSGGPVSPQ